MRGSNREVGGRGKEIPEKAETCERSQGCACAPSPFAAIQSETKGERRGIRRLRRGGSREGVEREAIHFYQRK